MNSSLPSLADGNRVQRAYHRWALPRYERMAPDLRERVEAVDRHLFSRKGLPSWLGLLVLGVSLVVFLHAFGLRWSLAIGLSVVMWLALLGGLIKIWAEPDRVLDKLASPRQWLLTLGGLALAVLALAALMLWLRSGRLGLDAYLDFLRRSGDLLQGMFVGAFTGLLGAAALVAMLRRQRDRARLEAERDAAAAQATEAQLRLLQAQIHPHFIFNTLAALQHWVDKTDPRAGPLLRELGAYLRNATEMLGRAQVPVTDELASVRHYLAIMKARWGERLHYATEIEPGLETRELPPGMLLTLVENAVEHGIAHRLDGGALTLHLRSAGESAWYVEVADDGVGLAADWQPGIGLTNLRKRLQHHFGPDATLTLQTRPEGGCLARLLIPR